MSTSILALPLRRRRDLLAARQRARQIASLLGFDRDERAVVAATAFEFARLTLEERDGATLHFVLAADRLQVFAEPGMSFRLERPLPEKGRAMCAEDVRWAVQELQMLTPIDLFEEVHHQNQEILLALGVRDRVEEAA
ncbi:MAG: hypothetical protein K2R98_24910 [Gemmataceae bacterium]|nr:hypothetical protein [Gemmataceae bacterium]